MYVSTIKDGLKVEFQEHLFDLRYSRFNNQDKIFFYRCTQANKTQCPALVIICRKQLFVVNCKHNHPRGSLGPITLKVNTNKI